MNFTASIALALATVLSGGVAPAQSPQIMPQAQTVQEYVQQYFADEPVMVAIAGCESNFRQYDTSGSVLKNPNSSAVGVFQIMGSVHSGTAADLNVDIYTTSGNLAYARYLYETSGTAPWTASKACWGKTPAVAKVASNKAIAVATR